MCPAADSPLADIDSNHPEELFMSLEKMRCGDPPPGNVLTDVNPYKYRPSDLPGDIWYLIHSKEDKDSELGFWKAKGEAYRLFSNSVFTGWRSTLEYFEGQAPHLLKTDWVMQEYWITQRVVGKNSKAKEASSLCRVFHGGEQASNHEKQQKMASVDIASQTHIHSTELITTKADTDTGHGSASKTEVNKDDETGILAVTGTPLNHPGGNLPDNDYLSGDYLELLDLAIPPSPSSSSDTSSCVTMSSDECFDAMALLQDLKPESNQDLVQKGTGCKFSVSASLRPSEVVVVPVSSGSINIEGSKHPAEEIIRTESAIPSLANRHKDTDTTGLKRASRSQKLHFRDEVPSNQDGPSSSSRSPNSAGSGKKAAVVRMKRFKKYMCFMPF